MSAQRRRGAKERGRKGRRIARATATVDSPPYITRKVPVYELASEELLELIEENTEIVLEEIGIDFRDDPRALQLFRDAGALVEEERVRFRVGCAVKSFSDTRRMNLLSTRGIRIGVYRSEATMRCSFQHMVHRSCAIWTVVAGMPRSKISEILPSSPGCRRPCIILAAPYVNP